MRRRVRAAAASRAGLAALAAVGLLAGCGTRPNPATVRTSSAADGPLDLGQSGGQALWPPQHRHGDWSATFGGFDVCTRGSSRVVLTGVTLETTGLRDAKALLHQVPPATVATVPPAQRWRYGPFGSTAGAPPRFDGTRTAPLGSYALVIGGLGVPSCTQNRAWSEQLGAGKVPAGAYTELVVTATAGTAGGRVQHAWVTFTVDGNPGREQLPWQMIWCGNDPRLRTHCR